MLMVHGGLMKAKVVDELTLLASLMAATVHDYGHGGVNNDFLNRSAPFFTSLKSTATQSSKRQKGNMLMLLTSLRPLSFAPCCSCSYVCRMSLVETGTNFV